MMKKIEKVICKRCVMDNESDNSISFDSEGYCNYCSEAIELKKNKYYPNKRGEEIIKEIVEKLKLKNSNKKYDCIIGVSGGLDSSYLLYLAKIKWGLRVLAVHVDDGFDTKISTSNIKKLCKKAKIELFTLKPNYDQYNDLLSSYILAKVPNITAFQDNILSASLYSFAKKNSIYDFFSGGNFALESILQQGNNFDMGDSKNIKSIHKKHGSMKIKDLQFISKFKKAIYEKISKINTYRPLNYINYNYKAAFQELNDFCDFRYYGSKHLENNLTAFVQLYWLPKKFNFDKRKSHYSSMIVSGQMTREEALQKLQSKPYEVSQIDNILSKISKETGFSKEKIDHIILDTNSSHYDYKTDRLFAFLKSIIFFINSKILNRKKIGE